MSLGYPFNATQEFNTTYRITKDLSGWDKTTIQVVGPTSGRIDVLGSNDGGATAYNEGSAELAINFVPVQVTNLTTGTAGNAIYGPGLFKLDANAQYMRLQGAPADSPTSIYRLLLFNSKIS